MKKTLIILMLATGLGSTSVIAADKQDRVEPLPRVPLMDVLDATARTSDLVFVVDEAAPPAIVVGQQKLRDIGYPELLVILVNNGLAAVRVEGLINVVPVARVRQYSIPIVDTDDESINDNEWVTVILQVENAPAVQFVPILRPILPQAGHLAAFPAANSILVVDRFANARRVAEIVAEFDAASEPQPKD